MADKNRVVVTDNLARQRYEAHLEEQMAGYCEYQLANSLIVLTHTQVDRAFEGQGVAGQLVRQVLDQVRAQSDRKVLVTCPFIKSWIQRHPEYLDMLYGS